MSFIYNKTDARLYAPGYFLADNEGCTRLTREIPQTLATTAADGSKYVPMGTAFPANTASIEGIVYEDVDVSEGNMPGSVVTCGVVYENRLPVALASAAKTALQGKGFVFIASEGAVVRPDDD